MNTNLSLPPGDDLDTTMRKAARAFAMDIYTRPQVLESLGITDWQFRVWENHPAFLKYLKQEQDAWRGAGNVAERTKLKAGIIMEEFMEQAYAELHDKKTPLNQRTELLKVITKVAGMEGNSARPGTAGVSGFSLQINIGPGKSEQITINAKPVPVLEPANNDDYDDYNSDLDYDPLVSPNTLEDL